MSKKYNTYQVTSVKDATKQWQIHETSTKQTVFQSQDKQRVMDLKLKLENGSGFNGCTPGFFTQKYPSFCD